MRTNWIILVVLSLLISCENTYDTEISQKGLIPLKVGNSWTYWMQKDEGHLYISTYKIIGATVINGKKWYNYNYAGIPMFINQFEDGIYSLGWLDTSTRQASLEFKYPAQVGEKYTFGNSTEVTVISNGTEVEVPAGKFWCYVYEFKYENDISIKYVAPGVGLVKTHYKSYDELQKLKDSWVDELAEYVLN